MTVYASCLHKQSFGSLIKNQTCNVQFFILLLVFYYEVVEIALLRRDFLRAAVLSFITPRLAALSIAL